MTPAEVLHSVASGADLARFDIASLPALYRAGIDSMRAAEDAGRPRVAGLQDWLAGLNGDGAAILAEIDSVRAAEVAEVETEAAETAHLPVINVTNRPLRDVTTDALAAIGKANNPPRVFVRGGDLARLAVDEVGRVLAEPHRESSMRGRLARVANFVLEEARGDEVRVRHIAPPLEVVRDVLTVREWSFPPLTGIITAPTIRPDGSVLSAPGYDAATGLHHQPAAGLSVPCVPAAPSRSEVDVALNWLREPLVDFPFVSDADRANAIGLVLTAVIRDAIPGPVPLCLIDATQAGTGKTKLAEVVSLVATGRPAKLTPLSRGDELRKELFSLLLGGDRLIVFDNLAGTLYAPVLAAALTATEYAGRVLGESRAPAVPQRAVWIATGNAIQLGGDMARRCYRVALDARLSQPWLRSGFRYADLLGWVGEHRGELLAAALTLARAWWAAGKPAATSPIVGSFESWSAIIGGILQHAGVAGFLANLNDVYELADEEAALWECFIGLVAARKPVAVTVSDLCELVAGDQAIRDALPDIGEVALTDAGAVRPRFKQALGFALRKRAGRRHGRTEARVERAADAGHLKVGRWRFMVG